MCAVQEVAAWGGIRGRNLSTVGDDLRLFPLRASHRPSCLLCALRDITQGGDGPAFLGLFEKPDKGKRSIIAFSANWGLMRINYHWQAIAVAVSTGGVRGARADSLRANVPRDPH